MFDIRFSGWEKLTGVLASALWLSGCASAPRTPDQLEYFRSPSLDYRPVSRSADGSVLGAGEQDPQDWLDATLTTQHLAPGWQRVDGELVYVPERRAAGRGAYIDLASCPEELGAPPEELAHIDPSEPQAPEELERASAAWYECPDPTPE